MKFDINRYIGETTTYDKKLMLEETEPISWLKSVSAFANTEGGILIFGIADDDTVEGIDNPKYASDKISEFIRNRIDPVPETHLSIENVDCEDSTKSVILLYVYKGTETPYFCSHKKHMEAFVRIGNSSVKADATTLRRLSLRGSNKTWDSLVSELGAKDYSFTRLKSCYHDRTEKSYDEDMYESWGIMNSDGRLTNAGQLLADDCPIKYSRIFCTRWSGNDMSGGIVNAIDSAEYQDNVIELLQAGEAFAKKHNHLMWKKLSNSRIDLPDYPERTIHEALVNGLVHRDYMETGSEVHLDIFDNRLEITSPGGMVDGSLIQNRDLYHIASKRRNPVIADIFHRLVLMERSGSGIKEIINEYKAAYNSKEECMPQFYSDSSCFVVTLWNLNYGTETEKNGNLANSNGNLANWEEELDEMQKKLLEMIRENPKIKRREMAERIGAGTRTISRAISGMAHVHFEGGGSTGHWVID